jgi:hypothetical protein
MKNGFIYSDEATFKFTVAARLFVDIYLGHDLTDTLHSFKAYTKCGKYVADY